MKDKIVNLLNLMRYGEDLVYTRNGNNSPYILQIPIDREKFFLITDETRENFQERFFNYGFALAVGDVIIKNKDELKNLRVKNGDFDEPGFVGTPVVFYPLKDNELYREWFFCPQCLILSFVNNDSKLTAFDIFGNTKSDIDMKNSIAI